MITIEIAVASCSSIKPLSSSPNKNFNNHVAASPSGTSNRMDNDLRSSSSIYAKQIAGHNSSLSFQRNIENISSLQFKYAVLTDVPVEELPEHDVLNYMEDWYGTPYRYGGSTKRGIDCSAFTVNMMATVFGIGIPRTVKEQFKASERMDKSRLQQGDLVFFNTRGGVSHVGIYLINNKFIHASTTGGVMISDLSEDYFKKKYIGAGRFKLP